MNNPFCGWLSPEGKLYKCSYWEHMDKAYEIVEKTYPNFNYNYSVFRFLEENKWLWINDDGYIGGDWEIATLDQVIFLLSNIEEMNDEMVKCSIDITMIAGYVDYETYCKMKEKYLD